MNAIPAASRTPRAGCSGRASFRDVALISGPSVRRARTRRLHLRGGKPAVSAAGWTGGTRLAKKAGRGGPGARPTAQGRVGQPSRHVASHLASHRLLSATSSRHHDVDRPLDLLPDSVRVGRGFLRALKLFVPRLEAQPGQCRLSLPEVSVTKLVPTGDVVTTPSQGGFRGKGVLAA